MGIKLPGEPGVARRPTRRARGSHSQTETSPTQTHSGCLGIRGLTINETPLHFKSITELAALIESKAISPVELTDALLTRIEEQDSTYKSYATVMVEQARASAQEAERSIAAGNYLGPLHGVPIAVKDLCFTKGVSTMGATKVLMDLMAWSQPCNNRI